MKIFNKTDEPKTDEKTLNGLVTIQIKDGIIVDIEADVELHPIFSTPRRAMNFFDQVKNAVLDIDIGQKETERNEI